MSRLDFRPILEELTESALRIRSTLRAAIESVLPLEADFTSRQIADALGLDKTSGWRCLRVATIADVAGILGSLPRGRGWTKILDALANAGCPNPTLAALREAVEALHDRIARRGISPATIEVIAAGELDDAAGKIVLRRIRQQHFESTLLMLGVSARARLGAMIVAPDECGDRAKVAGVTLVEGLDRHREGPPWNIHVGLSAFGKTATGSDEVGPPCPFLPAWSRPATLGEEIVAELVAGRWRFDFVNRRPDDDGVIRVALCESMPGSGPLRTEDPDKLVTFAMPHGLPAQVAVFDLLLHRSINPSAVPYASLYATIDREGRGVARTVWPETTRLPLDSSTEELEDPCLPTPLDDLNTAWRELLGHGVSTIGCGIDEFRVHRTVVPHPPLPSTMVVRWGLPGVRVAKGGRSKRVSAGKSGSTR